MGGQNGRVAIVDLVVSVEIALAPAGVGGHPMGPENRGVLGVDHCRRRSASPGISGVVGVPITANCL